MASSSTQSIPSLNRIYIISTWVETALWGFNTVVFAVVCHLLFGQLRGQRNKWILFGTSALLYLCATIHVAASLRQELEAFIFIPSDAPSYYASLYYADQSHGIALLKNSTYAIAMFIQDLVLTWRMHVVWAYNWSVIVLPISLVLVRLGVSVAGIVCFAQGLDATAPIVRILSDVGWPVELVINISVTAAIASRLWSTGSRLSQAMSQPSRTNKYIRHIFLLVESGALLIGITIVVFILYNLNDPAALAVLDVATQVAALVVYLVIVRSRFGLTHGLPGSTPDKSVTTSSLGNMVFRMDNLDRVRGDTACIQVTREVVTDAGKNSEPSVDVDYKMDRGLSYAV
ncbi:hypothetical protein GSI_15127 [Ganoderma sinense ZZ0214-1]|uniref:Uncharacterized protein n=1 Tax=Ganoderma sinense ZZ0214-1 TaxID=1077348 RepID=A0A2G8RLP4_9APHY|nr:hypothetical protein GSI_15127 [Ganoderma sinense ZZ0214-1]